ncbi:hypothetical protein PCYB_003860, partial [Plasmodium cynomolgi strain B]
TIHGYNVIANNTNFLFSTKDAQVEGDISRGVDLKEAGGGEAEWVEWPGGGSALESAVALLKDSWAEQDGVRSGDVRSDHVQSGNVQSDHVQSSDVQSGHVHHFGSGDHGGESPNEQAPQQEGAQRNGGGGDGGGDGGGQDDRSKLFNLAMELKDGSNNRKKTSIKA